MAVVGVDFGNHTCYISVARAGGIETIANDYSLRETPSVVGFSDRQRILGVGAKSQLLTNLKRTVFNFKHMLGRKFDDPVVQETMKGLPFAVVEGPNKQVRIQVNYMGEGKLFSPEEITAMLFTKLKETAEDELKTKVKDVVISCPAYFTDCERRALLDSASIAGLNVLKLINDTTATALAYGIYKQDLPAPEEKARNVVFVDLGHVGLQIAISSFNKGKLTMKALSFARNVGGQSFDEALVSYFGQEFKNKTKLDIREKPRAVLKLTTEVEKIKKQMSANTNRLPLNIECFMDDRDMSAHIDRTTFEGLIGGQLQKMEEVMIECLNGSEMKLEDIYAVEVVGGATRIPAVKSIIEKVFGKVPQTTLNSDEAVSRGCALQCAILSPTFRVREFSVTDLQPYAVKLNWTAESDTGDMVVFPKFHAVPFSKLLTFHRRDNFAVEAEYADEEEVPLKDKHIGHFEIGEVKPLPDGGGCQKVKVKVRINLNGVFTVSSANFVEKHEVEEEVQMDVDEAKSPPEEAAKEGVVDKEVAAKEDAEMKDVEKKEKKTEKRKKMVSKTIDLPITPRVVGALSRDKLAAALDQEKRLANQDRSESERLTAKNAVEEYIYGIRQTINNELVEYIVEADREAFSRHLEDTEYWLYEEGEDCEKPVYEERLKALKMVGEAAKRRKSEFEGRKAAVEALGHSLQMAYKVVDLYKSGDEKYDHLSASEVDRVSKLIEDKRAWLDSSVATLEQTAKTTNPSVLVCQFYTEKDGFEAVSRPILNKSKPKVEPPPPPPPTKDQEASKNEEKDTSSKEEEETMEAAACENDVTVNGNNGQPQQTMELD